jgi:hypothetical protein
MLRAITFLTCLPVFMSYFSVLAAEEEPIDQLDEFVVEGRSQSLIGETVSASQGSIGQVDLELRPLQRTGDVLESIPGLIVTQHSGSGKSNQYFLRGFNLDHGTDFATFVDGMPVNMPTHGHGQGYTDINFIIPELIDEIHYKKGPYYAEVGDFSSAGSTHLRTVRSLDQGIASIGLGQDNFVRTLLADSTEVKGGSFSTALETQFYDGPWTNSENLEKYNGLIKYSNLTSDNARYQITFMGYDSSWDSADQIPLRAVQSGLISRLDSLDDRVGGESSRYSLSGTYDIDHGDSATKANVYGIYYDLNLWSNFTYFLDDPINGDQFEQVDKRMIYGGNIAHTLFDRDFMGSETDHTIAAQIRLDDISDVGLHKTQNRTRISTIREDDVLELSLAAYYQNEIRWTDQFRTVFGMRGDYFSFDVDSDNSANSGKENDFLLSPKLNLIYTATESLELYASAGLGFHSNDARGTTITVDPSSGASVTQVDPLVQSQAVEAGARFTWSDKLNSSVSIWSLDLDSELLFVGDAGTTEATTASRRYGIEFANFYRPTDWITFDLDLAFTEAEFDNNPAGSEIPGALDTVLSTGVTLASEVGMFGTVRLRYFGPRQLVEDGSVESASSTVVNLKTGYRSEHEWDFHLDVLNLFDSGDDDITYYYESQLAGEPGGVEDIHSKIMEPRTFRAYLTYHF